MNTRTFSRYSYSELRTAATSDDAQQIDIDTLGAWFDAYGQSYWNGEYYDADDGLRLFPIIKWDDDLDQGETVGFEFR